MLVRDVVSAVKRVVNGLLVDGSESRGEGKGVY